MRNYLDARLINIFIFVHTWGALDQELPGLLYTSIGTSAWALYSSKKFCKIEIIPLLFVFDKYYPIMD